jgi:hypothetical protein
MSRIRRSRSVICSTCSRPRRHATTSEATESTGMTPIGPAPSCFSGDVADAALDDQLELEVRALAQRGDAGGVQIWTAGG